MGKEKLDAVLDRVRAWPDEEDAARMLEAMERLGTGVYRLTREERAAVLEGLAEAERGEFVSEDEMQAYWDRHQKRGCGSPGAPSETFQRFTTG